MKRFIFLLFLSSCTVHQSERIAEYFLPQKQREILRNEHLVQDALFNTPSPAQFSIERLNLELPSFLNIYSLRGESLPQNERLILASFNSLQKKVTIHLEFELHEDHSLTLYYPYQEKRVKEIPIVLKELLQGQEIELVLISKEKRTCTRVPFTPHPITMTTNGAHYSLQTTHKKGTHFILHGSGLDPNESILIREESGSKCLEHPIIADETGCFTQPIEPIVYGILGGNGQISINREALPSSTLSFTWGAKLDAVSCKTTPFCPLLFAVGHAPREQDALALLPQIQKALG